nr:uncharacterized protein LOC111847771 isoform X2 [Paramormyrops kingsleyae]
MPPEKKRKVNVTVQPAIARQYLAEHFKDYGEEPSTPLVDEPSPIVKEDDNDRPTPCKDSEEVLVLQESDSPVIKSTPLPLSPQPGPSSTVSLRSDQMTPRKAKMKQETESARLHNIDAEELMGMFSAAQRRGPSATLCFLSCRMRAIKNRTVKYLHSLDEEKRDKILKKAVSYGRQQRMKRRKRQKYLSDELIKRQDEKKQARHSAKRRELERNMKYGLESVLKDFTVNEETKEQIQDILDGRAVGRNIAHVWNEDGNIVSYNGRIEKLKKASCKYRVSYWNHDGAYEDAEDYDMSIFALAVDLLLGDLILSD